MGTKRAAKCPRRNSRALFPRYRSELLHVCNPTPLLQPSSPVGGLPTRSVFFAGRDN